MNHALDSMCKVLLQWIPDWITTTNRYTADIYYRNSVECVVYFIRQSCYATDLLYNAIIERDMHGNKIYGEMNSVDWWWEEPVSSNIWNLAFNWFELILLKDLISINGHAGETVLLVICHWEETYLTNFSCGKKDYPVYLLLGNIHTHILNRYSKIAVVLLALLSVKTNLTDISTTADGKYQTFYVNQLQQVLELILRPLKLPEIHISHLDCEISKIGDCYSIFTTWCANHQKYVNCHERVLSLPC